MKDINGKKIRLNTYLLADNGDVVKVVGRNKRHKVSKKSGESGFNYEEVIWVLWKVSGKYTENLAHRVNRNDVECYRFMLIPAKIARERGAWL